jgi:ABC-type multidrug transport system permease subunit
VVAGTLVEIPYLIVSTFIFIIPFFYIVGFDKGAVTEKFFWYCLFYSLYTSLMVFLGQLLSFALPNAASANGKLSHR